MGELLGIDELRAKLRSSRSMDYDTALDFFWNLSKSDRRLVDREGLTGKEEAALDDVIEAESDPVMRKYVVERTIGRAKAKELQLDNDFDGLAQKLADFLNGKLKFQGREFGEDFNE